MLRTNETADETDSEPWGQKKIAFSSRDTRHGFGFPPCICTGFDVLLYYEYA